MKRVIMLAAIAVLVPAAPAHAEAEAPKDPVKALKSQFAPGKGVKFTDRTTFVKDGESSEFLKRTGAFQFGKGGVTAWRMDATFAPNAAELAQRAADAFQNDRTIRIGKTSYLSGPDYREDLPEGKSWQRTAKGEAGTSSWFSQPVNVTEPATLKVLLAKGKASGNTYSGTTTFAELAKVSPWFRSGFVMWHGSKTKVTWKLTVNAKGLAQNLTTSFPAEGLIPTWEGITLKIDTRLTGWGTKVSIKAPPAAQVSTKQDG